MRTKKWLKQSASALLTGCLLLSPLPMSALASGNEEAAYPRQFDLRNVDGVNYVTPVKFQNPWGTCWGFSAIAAAETSVYWEMRHDLGITDMPIEMIDFSERQLAWFARSVLPEDDETFPSQRGEGIHVFDSTYPLNVGGAAFTATSVFSTGTGPVFESYVPYQGNAGIVDRSGAYYSEDDDWSVDEDYRYVLSFELEESNILPSPAVFKEDGTYVYDEEATNIMKSELMQGRAISVGLCADTSLPNQEESELYINTETWAHYTYEDVISNHAVTIVGWDDDYPKENFLEEHQPPENGAWIVKNSWGASSNEFPTKADWGLDGYFYLSYYDRSIDSIETFNFDVEKLLTNETGYHFADEYDLMPSIGEASGFPLPMTVHMANVFTAEQDQKVRSLSVETFQENTSATYQLYLLDEGYALPTEGELLFEQEVLYPHGGYHRLELEDGCLIPADRDYAVVVTLLQPDGQYGLLMDVNFNEAFAKEIDLPFYATAVVNPGESFVYLEEEGAWLDWTVALEKFTHGEDAFLPDWYVYDNFPIKSYSDPVVAEASEIYSDLDMDAWYYEGVNAAVKRKWMDGASETTFAPDAPATRAVLAEALYRMAIVPSAQEDAGLTDVPADATYAKAVNWAVANKMMDGYGGGLFGPEDPITREQLATLLWRYAGEPTSDGSLDGFADKADVSSGATDALRWAVEKELIVDQGDGNLNPGGQVTRAEAATILLRYVMTKK